MATRRSFLAGLFMLTPIAATASPSNGVNCPVCGQAAKMGPGLPLVTAAPMDDFAPMRHVWCPIYVCSQSECGVVFRRDVGPDAGQSGVERTRRDNVPLVLRRE